MKKWTIFTHIIAFLFFAVSSWAWYPDQEKDGIKDDKSPEEVKKLIEKGKYGMRWDYEPKPGFPWKEDQQKGTLTGEQLAYLDFDRYEYGFYTQHWWRNSARKNARGHILWNAGLVSRVWEYNTGQPLGQNNYRDVLDYHKGKIKEGDMRDAMIAIRYGPALDYGVGLLIFAYLKTPAHYKEVDMWRYFPDRRKVIRLGAADKADSIGGGNTTYDDVTGREVWEWEYKILGTDVLAPEQYWFGHNVLEAEPVTKPIECYVYEAKARDKGHYLGKRIVWISKNDFYRIREEQYDRSMNLWKIFESFWSEPYPSGDRMLLRDETWDLQIDYLDLVIRNDSRWMPKEDWKIPGGNFKQFFNLETLTKERFWDKYPPEHWGNKVRAQWKKLPPPKILREKFPEHRKIVLREEVQEKVKKLLEEGIYE